MSFERVRVGSLEVDRAPVTNGRYREFVAAAGHRPPRYWPQGNCPAHLEDHPVVGVDFFDALAFAEWAGGRLPTEEEWIAAAGLASPAPFPWGADFDASRCNTVKSSLRGTSPVGAYSDGTAPSGCVDLCGNVWEMTCTPDPRDEQSILVKGGSWYDFPAHARLDAHAGARLHKSGATIGFRLVYGDGAGPTFLPPGLVAECIAFRRKAAGHDGPEVTDTGEYRDVLSDLRLVAASRIDDLRKPLSPALALPSEAVSEVLERIESSEPEAAPEADPLPAPPLPRLDLDEITARMERWTERLASPRVLVGSLLGACLLAGLALLWNVRSQQPPPASGSGGRSPQLAAAPATAASRDPATPQVFAQAVRDLSSKDSKRRAAAERVLLSAPLRARPYAEEGLHEGLPARAESTLRYVLACAAETDGSDNGLVFVVDTPPGEGLVFFFSSTDEETGKALAVARRTAKAQSVPFAAVYEGELPLAALRADFAKSLHGAPVYRDAGEVFARRLGIAQTPALAGLREGGRLAFVQRGSFDRTRLSRLACILASS